MWHVVLEDDYLVKMWSFILNIWRGWPKEWDAMKSLAKAVEISKNEFSIISSTYEYKLEWSIWF